MSFLGKEIFPIPLYYTLEHTLLLDNVTASMGDGFEQRVTKDLLWDTYINTEPRPDGLGNSGEAYRGTNLFGINMRNLQHVNDTRGSGSLKRADLLWLFYQERGGTLESFWFYNPAENGTIDLTGVNDTGRYLVRFRDQLTRSLFARHLYNATINLIEVRE